MVFTDISNVCFIDNGIYKIQVAIYAYQCIVGRCVEYVMDAVCIIFSIHFWLKSQLYQFV